MIPVVCDTFKVRSARGHTMAEIIEKARIRLKEIEEEAERLRVFLAVADELRADNPVDESESSVRDKSPDDDPDSATPAEIVEQVRRLIEEKERPLGRGALVKILRARGVKLPGKDPAKNVGTVIWRSKQFDNIAGHGYWPKDMPRWIGQRQRELGVE